VKKKILKKIVRGQRPIQDFSNPSLHS